MRVASGYQRQLKAKKGEASCTCSDPRGSSAVVKQGAADASQKPIDPSSLSITEAPLPALLRGAGGG